MLSRRSLLFGAIALPVTPAAATPADEWAAVRESLRELNDYCEARRVKVMVDRAFNAAPDFRAICENVVGRDRSAVVG